MQNRARNTENASILVKRDAESELSLAEICRCLWGSESKDRIELRGGKKNTLQVPNPPVLCSIFKMTVGSKTPLCFVMGKYIISPIPWDEVLVLTEGEVKSLFRASRPQMNVT